MSERPICEIGDEILEGLREIKRGEVGRIVMYPPSQVRFGAPEESSMEITTPRLLLRDFTEADLPALLRYQADPRYSEFHGPEESAPDFAHNLIGMFLAWAVERPRQNYQLAIAQRDSPDEAIGSCGVRLRGCEAGRAEFGLELAAEHWGRGFASEAAHAILEFGFRDLGVEEVRGITITENVRVQRLVERLGFTQVETRPGPAWMEARGWSERVWGIKKPGS